MKGTPYNGLVVNSAGVVTFCSVRDCSVELAPLQVNKFWPVGSKRVKADTSGHDTFLRLATSCDVAPVVSAPLDGAEEGESEARGLLLTSFLDYIYIKALIFT